MESSACIFSQLIRFQWKKGKVTDRSRTFFAYITNAVIFGPSHNQHELALRFMYSSIRWHFLALIDLFGPSHFGAPPPLKPQSGRKLNYDCKDIKLTLKGEGPTGNYTQRGCVLAHLPVLEGVCSLSFIYLIHLFNNKMTQNVTSSFEIFAKLFRRCRKRHR